MGDNKIFDDDFRKNWLKTTDYKSLNEYLKNMEKLSIKKGGKFLDMYNKDIDFLLYVNDKQYQDGGNIMQLFGLDNKTKNKSNDKQIQASEVCNTEAYINKITNITQGSYCPIITQKTNNCDNTCTNRFNELSLIKQTLLDDTSCKKKNNDWQKAVNKFIDLLMCCGNLFSQDQYEPLRNIYFKELSKIITNNPKFLKEAFSYLSKIIPNEKNKISNEFMKQYAELRNSKNKLTQSQYIDTKEKLIANSITKLGPNGFQTVYISKFVEKVINAYNNL